MNEKIYAYYFLAFRGFLDDNLTLSFVHNGFCNVSNKLHTTFHDWLRTHTQTDFLKNDEQHNSHVFCITYQPELS